MNVNNFKILVTLVFQSANQYDDNINNVCAISGYASIEIRTTGFTGRLNLRCQMVKVRFKGVLP
jgi:hypothetical protein